MTKGQVKKCVNFILFVAYFTAVLEAGTYGLIVLSLFGLSVLLFAYFVLFGIVIWIDYLKEIFYKPKKRQITANFKYDERPIIEQLDEAFGKGKK